MTMRLIQTLTPTSLRCVREKGGFKIRGAGEGREGRKSPCFGGFCSFYCFFCFLLLSIACMFVPLF